MCSTRGGFGAAVSMQMDFEANDTFLILVGQRGTSPCDTDTSLPLCQTPPSTFSEAVMCGENWKTFSYMGSGGGGGGGGSMVWPQNATGGYSKGILPLVAVSGGGGTSAILNYSSIITSSIPIGSQSAKEYYNSWINGQLVDVDGLNPGNSGSTGNKPTQNSAGFGSGWRFPNIANDDFMIGPDDGKLLSQSTDFAIGGQNCSNALPFSGVTGGFGGGGGACSEGGGGGGYGGGWVLLSGNDIPGRGGYSLLTDLNETIMSPNEGDGYVKIFPLDCGCASGQCTINGDSFACVCVDPKTKLAADNFTCIRGQ